MVGVSIVMPLYNAVHYLGESLESILCQSFSDFELICVNDGSTDATMDILMRYQSRDDRLRIISNEERCGAAYSRNRGMSIACGKYLAFLDGDDIFDKRMLEKAYFAIEERAADIVMFEYQHVPSNRIHCKIKHSHGPRYKEKFCNEIFSVRECEPYEFISWSTGPWNKLYRKDFIEANQISFQNLSCANDMYFVCMALMLSERTIVLDDEAVMIYVRDHDEAHRISADRDSMCSYKALMKIGQELIKRDKFVQLYEHFYYRVLFSLRDGLVADKKEQRVRAFYAFLQKEGVANLCGLGRQYYDKMDEYLREELGQFAKKSFESGWYQEENILKVYLEKNAEVVIDWYHTLRAAGARIAIWGAGANGKSLLEFCRLHNLEIEAVIDKSEKRQGDIVQGCTIVSPAEALDKVQVVLISARLIYDEVIKEVDNSEIEVVDINQFLCLV